MLKLLEGLQKLKGQYAVYEAVLSFWLHTDLCNVLLCFIPKSETDINT